MGQIHRLVKETTGDVGLDQSLAQVAEIRFDPARPTPGPDRGTSGTAGCNQVARRATGRSATV